MMRLNVKRMWRSSKARSPRVLRRVRGTRRFWRSDLRRRAVEVIEVSAFVCFSA